MNIARWRCTTMSATKIGGCFFLPALAAHVATQMATTAVPTIIVHGGGRAIAGLQTQLGLEAVKVDGLRVTDAASLEAAEMVLSAKANKQIVKALLAAGVEAVGLSGVDGRLLQCEKKRHDTADLGYVGTIVHVRAELLRRFSGMGLTVVLSPVSLGLDGCTYNVNADEAAAAVAQALPAERLTFLSNVPGVLRDGRILPTLTIAQTESLIAAGVIRDGMVPKVRAALHAVSLGVLQARIVNLAGLGKAGGTIFTAEERRGRGAEEKTAR